MSMKINKLEIDNVKRVKAVSLKPTENGLTIIGGNNGQGKTSILDAIAWTLGGDSYRPSQPERAGSMTPPTMKIIMSNGLVVERKGSLSRWTCRHLQNLAIGWSRKVFRQLQQGVYPVSGQS